MFPPIVVNRKKNIFVVAPVFHIDLKLAARYDKVVDDDDSSARLSVDLVGDIEIKVLDLPFLSLTSRFSMWSCGVMWSLSGSKIGNSE